MISFSHNRITCRLWRKETGNSAWLELNQNRGHEGIAQPSIDETASRLWLSSELLKHCVDLTAANVGRQVSKHEL